MHTVEHPGSIRDGDEDLMRDEVLRRNCAAAQEDPDKNYGRKERRRAEEINRRAARSELFQELVQEVEGAPEEVRPRPGPFPFDP